MNKIFFIVAFSLTLVSYKDSTAQQLMLPLGELYQQTINYEINQTTSDINTGFKPLLKSEANRVFEVDSMLYKISERDAFFKNHKKNWIWRKLLFEDFISIEKETFNLYVNPLFYVEYGKVTETGQSYLINTRAIELKGDIGKKLSFYSSFRENQATFRPYIYDWAWNRLVVPGQGALKKNNNNLSEYDFSSASAYLSFTPFNWFHIQVGQDKNFIGEGHRSLLLSDNSSNYPFAKFTFTYKSFKYVTLFAEFEDFEGAYYDYHFKKHGAFNYLSYNFKNRFEIGLFEGSIFRTTDTSAYFNRFKADYFIPILGVRTAVNGFDSEHHILIGLNTKLKLTDFIQAYGQIALDDPSKNELAYQGGIKVFDVLHGKINKHRLYVQAEYNEANPRTYSHADLKYQTWSHYNQELAHPAGSDFSEIVVQASYSYKSFLLDFKYSNLTLNRRSSFSDIYMLDNSSYLIAPVPTEISHSMLTGAYIINPRTNLQIYAGFDFRTEQIENTKDKSSYFMFGIRTGLNNFYYDF